VNYLEKASCSDCQLDINTGGKVSKEVKKHTAQNVYLQQDAPADQQGNETH
jgi:hypothetical protein